MRRTGPFFAIEELAINADESKEQTMTKCLRVALIVLLAFWIADVSKGQTPADDEERAGKEAMTPAEEAERANAIARALANPVANLWSLEFQFNNFQLTNDRWNYNLNFQPVLPVSLTGCLNLITRPVIQVYDSEPYQTSTGANARTTNFGDWTQLELLSPTNTGHWLLGAGPTFIFPTGGSVYTGPGKVPGRAGGGRRLHDLEVHRRRLPAAVVVLCRRPQPPEHEPVKPPAPSQFLLPRRLECGLFGKHLR